MVYELGGYGDRGDRGDYGDRPPRQEVPIPTAPPYTAFVGNLSFEVTDSDVEGFFSGLTVRRSLHDDTIKGLFLIWARSVNE